MLSRKVLLALLGCLVISTGFVRAEDSADGEIHEETAQAEDGVVGPSSDAAVSFLFTTPSEANLNQEVVAGKLVKFLIGFQNKGEKDFTVKFSQASLRYHQDFNYPIQNFTAGQYNRRVAPKEEVTVDYGFFASEQLAGRPLGLVVDLHYEDSEGRYFINTVYNSTINFLEDDSSSTTETTFLFVIFAGFIVLAFLVGQHYLNKLTKKSGISKKTVEYGTAKKGEVDFEWIPRENIKNTKSPKPGSPRPRKAQKAE